MHKTKQYIPILAGLLLLGGLGIGRSDSDDLASQATLRLVAERGTVTFAEGAVAVRRLDTGWEPLYVGDRVGPDDAVRSDEGGRAEMTWERPNCIIRLERASVIDLESAAVGGRLMMIGVRLDRGAVWARAHRTFRLTSPYVSATLDRATLSLRADVSSDRLAVYHGTAQIDGLPLSNGEGVIVGDSGTHTFAVGVEDDMRDGWQDVSGVARAARNVPGQESLPETRRLTRDLKDLSPEIYLGVEVELTGKATGEAEFEADAARIRKIRVRSSKWDVMRPDRKVQLLNDTFYVLRERYPSILETVVLEFDDNRPRLSLKYAATG